MVVTHWLADSSFSLGSVRFVIDAGLELRSVSVAGAAGTGSRAGGLAPHRGPGMERPQQSASSARPGPCHDAPGRGTLRRARVPPREGAAGWRGSGKAGAGLRGSLLTAAPAGLQPPHPRRVPGAAAHQQEPGRGAGAASRRQPPRSEALPGRPPSVAAAGGGSCPTAPGPRQPAAHRGPLSLGSIAPAVAAHGPPPAGTCLRLYSEAFYEQRLPPSPAPHVSETSLSRLVLLLKRLDIADMGQCDFLDRPGRARGARRGRARRGDGAEGRDGGGHGRGCSPGCLWRGAGGSRGCRAAWSRQLADAPPQPPSR